MECGPRNKWCLGRSQWQPQGKSHIYFDFGRWYSISISSLQDSLHQARQRQAAAAQAAALSTPSKAGQFSPQRYDNALGKGTNGAQYNGASPKGPTFNASMSNGYDATLDNELAMGMRGMAVEEDYAGGQYRQQGAVSQGQSAARGPPPAQQGRGPYNGYTQQDYAGYYSNGNGMEYGYPYSNTGGDPYASSAGMANGASPYPVSPVVGDFNRQQPGVFYDYSAQARPGSQYYYPTHQAMMYPTMPNHSPMPTPQLSAAVPATLSEKKRDLQV